MVGRNPEERGVRGVRPFPPETSSVLQDRWGVQTCDPGRPTVTVVPTCAKGESQGEVVRVGVGSRVLSTGPRLGTSDVSV